MFLVLTRFPLLVTKNNNIMFYEKLNSYILLKHTLVFNIQFCVKI